MLLVCSYTAVGDDFVLFPPSLTAHPSILRPRLAAISPNSPHRSRSSAVIGPCDQPPRTTSLRRNLDSSLYGSGGSRLPAASCSTPSITDADAISCAEDGGSSAVAWKRGVIGNEADEAGENGGGVWAEEIEDRGDEDEIVVVSGGRGKREEERL
jgi:hypothetical protein